MSRDVPDTPAGLILELGLTVALGLAAWSGSRALGSNWQSVTRRHDQQVAADSYLPSTMPAIASLGGVSPEGQAVLLEPSPNLVGSVIFVLHGAALQHDLEYWEVVHRRLASRNGVQLVGYCDGRACIAGLRAMHPSPPFTIVGYTEYHTAKMLLQADADHLAVVLDGELRSLGGLRWSASNPPDLIAAEISRML